MARRKQSRRAEEYIKRRKQRDKRRYQNKTCFHALLEWLIPDDELFIDERFHGNSKWRPEQLARQAVIWSWQDTRNVTDAFAITAEVCQDLGMHHIAKSYTAFMDASGVIGHSSAVG